MSKIKIIYTISDAGTGGGQTHLLEVLRNLNRKRFEILLVCPPQGHYVKSFIKYVDKYYFVDFNQILLKTIVQLQKIFKTEKPDIIHNHLLRASLLAAPIGLCYTSKVLNHLHGSVIDNPNAPIWKVKLYSFGSMLLNRFGCRYIAVSNFNKQQLIREGINKSDISVIYNGIDEALFKRSSSYILKEKEQLIGVCVARLAPEKGLFTLLNVAKELEGEVVFQIVGDGPQREGIENYMREHQIKNVQLVGFQKDVRPFLEQADFFILTSEWEAMGIVIVEAMAYRLPVIASRVGGIPELVIEGEGGYLCDVGDVNDFVDKVNGLMNNANLIEVMGTFNQTFFRQKFTLLKMYETLEKLYVITE